MKIKIISFSLTILALLIYLPTVILAKPAQVTFLPLGFSIEATTFENIPFQIWGATLAVQQPPEGQGDDVYYSDFPMPPVQANKVHFIQTSIWAAELEDETVIGQIRVCYSDSSCDDPVDLVIGINTAEWSYDRPELQDILAHTKISPAYSYRTDTDSDFRYWAHSFYIGIDTDPVKTLASVELFLDEETSEDTESVGVTISAITIEIPEAPPEMEGRGIVTCADGIGRCNFSFIVKSKEGQEWPLGYLLFKDPDAEVTLVASDFRRFGNSYSYPGQIFLTGWGQIKGEKSRFNLRIADNGDPGADNDLLLIRIFDLDNVPIYEIGLQPITEGNILVINND